MAQEAQIVVTGNLGNDPELKATSTGKTFVRFSLANTPAKLIKGTWENQPTVWFTCTAWEELAASIVHTYKKGDKVRVEGRLVDSFWTDKEGNEKRSLEISIDWIGTPPIKVPKPVIQNPEVTHRTDDDPFPVEDFPW